MKRLLILLLISIMSVTFFVLPVVANSADSLHLSAKEEAQLNLSSDDIVVKLFSGMFMSDFSKQEDIATMASKSNSTYLVVKRFGEPIYFKDHYGEIVKLNPATKIPDWSDFYKYAVYENSVFDSSVKINAVYCLNGEPSHDGVYIYYETDHGEYVLYKEFLAADETYLFPISDFYKFSKAVCDMRELYKYHDGGGVEIDEVFNVEDYLFKPGFKPRRDFRWITITLIISTVLVTVGGVLWLSYHRKAPKS